MVTISGWLRRYGDGGQEREYYRSLVLERLTNKNPRVLKTEVCFRA
jgi:hypothetical protein